jgi:hypothetical protein
VVGRVAAGMTAQTDPDSELPEVPRRGRVWLVGAGLLATGGAALVLASPGLIAAHGAVALVVSRTAARSVPPVVGLG